MGSIEPVHRGPAPQPVAHVETISTIGWPDVAGDALRQHCYAVEAMFGLILLAVSVRIRISGTRLGLRAVLSGGA
jgi:hypothetical protein